ncbi:hypothetical protein TSUD_359730 [Trifolium subterraneum]|uniref:Uncharacterized protein n=1 Tax=Trifolium subterraneum TaxID=3900 RepID=A0A2Z6MLZ8_TRISU|nr:hypothetical protein TSUD_359730 [Trifolium subterraneum]
MASFLYDLVKPCVEKLIDGAIAEARHVFCFTCIVKEFEEERTRLEPERITIKQRVKVAKERDKDIQANVVSWQKDIDELNQVDTKTKQTCFFGFCPDCIWRYKKGKELANKVKRIKELKGEKFENIELPRHVPGIERYSSKDYISFKSREAKYKELLDSLKDDNNYIIGLQGMGGIGKTTLAKEVGKELNQAGQFAHVVDTTVSSTPDIKKIQDEIAGPLGLELKDCNESDRHKKLWSRLTNDPPFDFDAIGIPKQDNHKGCKVLVTSRSKETFNQMDCDKIIELGLLSEEEAWIMFERYARISNSSSKELIDKGREIAQECKQLPVAISVIASSLKGHQHQVHKWDVTLESLKKHEFMHGVDKNKAGIYNCLKISYDNLTGENIKQLFLLCSVFREDNEYTVDILTRLCIGMGLFGVDNCYYNDARNQVVDAKDKLVDSCLLLEDGEKCLRMHDLVREAAQWIGKEEIQCVNLFDKKQKSLVENQKNIKYVLCEGKCMDFFNLKFDGSKLEMLIVVVDGDEDRECDISILGNLQSLETLDLVSCKINELPNQIINLKKFKLLNLEDCKIRMKNPFEVIEGCSSLEELFPKYVVFCGDEDEACQFSEETLKHCMQTANALCLEGIKGEWRNLMPEMVSVELGMNDLVELHLVEISQLQCLIDTNGSHVPNVLSNLVVLKLKKMEKLKELFHGTRSFESLNNLEKLSIKDCKHLQSLFKGKLLCNLKSITIQSCPLLVFLFEVSTSQSLVLLEKLKIADCEGLETIIADERTEDEEIDDGGNNKSYGSMFSKLKVINIERCHRLKYVFGQSQNVELVSLSELALSALPKFISIFEECYDPMSSRVKGSSSTSNYGSKAQIQLDPLKCNIFSCCQTRIPLVDDVDGDQPHDNSVAPESNSYRLNIWERLGIQSKIFCNIKEIVLTHFPKMKSVFILSIDLIMQLETLKIMNCDELKHVIIDTGDHNTGGNNWVNVFPKLEELDVEDCEQLEYIFGHDTSDHQNHMEVQLHFPELTDLRLVGLPSLIATCPKQYRIAFPSLKSLELGKCSQDTTIIKQLSGNVDHFLTLKILELYNNSKLENIFSLNEIDGQQLDLGLQKIKLIDLPMMTCLFLGPKNSFALKKLRDIRIVGCEKLKIAFSTSILRFLPQLRYLRIEECEELEHIIEDDLENKDNSNSLSSTTCFPKLERLSVTKCNRLKFVFSTSILRFLPQLCYISIEECEELEHIIEDDLENKDNSNSLSSTTCFPKLEQLAVIKCNKLKFVFPFSVCKELPKLKVLMIAEANELEELFKSEDDQKVDIPNLKIVAFDMLRSLCRAQGNQFQAVKNRFVRNCQKLTLTSASTTNTFEEIKEIYRAVSNGDYELYRNVRDLFKQLPSEETTRDFEKPSVENVQDLTILPTNSKGIEIEGTSKTNNDQVSLNDDVFMKVNSNVEKQFSNDDDIIVSKSKSSPRITSPIVSPFPSMPSKGDPSQEIEDLAILPTNSEELLNEQWMDQQHSLGKTDTIVKPSQGIEIEGTPKTNNDQVSQTDNAFMKINSKVEEQFSKDDEITVSKFKPSPGITSQFPSMPSKGDPSQKVEDISSSLLVTRELEQLVSKNHLDYENLSLLTDFLVKNPSVRLKDTSLRDRYKGCAYNLLAELLKFLETHSLLEVSGSCHSEFVELLQDARYFAFDKEWLDGVERRALSPQRQVSPDALEKLLESKKRVTKDVEDLRFKIDILSQHVEDLKHQLTSSEAVLESIIQQEAVLTAPIGY